MAGVTVGWCCIIARQERYGEQLATWGETIGRGVKKYGSIVVIARE